MLQFQLDPSAKQPLYRQLVQQVTAAVQAGTLLPGTKLPPVRQLARELSTASGTITRAYDELAHMGVIQMTQGKGTFVANPATAESRKERAMQTIDEMLDEMGALEFSPQEIQIFLDLKLRERLLREKGLRIAAVAKSPECLRAVTEKLYGLPDVAVYPLTLDDAKADPSQIMSDMDLIVATDLSYAPLEALPIKRAILVRFCLQLSRRSLSRLARLPQGCRVGLLVQNQIFAETVRSACDEVCQDVIVQETRLLGGRTPPELSCCDAVLVPAGFELACTSEEQGALREYSEGHPLIRLELEPDKSSLRALEEALAQCTRRKNRF